MSDSELVKPCLQLEAHESANNSEAPVADAPHYVLDDNEIKAETDSIIPKSSDEGPDVQVIKKVAASYYAPDPSQDEIDLMQPPKLPGHIPRGFPMKPTSGKPSSKPPPKKPPPAQGQGQRLPLSGTTPPRQGPRNPPNGSRNPPTGSR
ncbi:hypothetical protein DFH07DRAFT_778082 [Mycena maculata]|uniref:Uncharacterized protein n=1 Tax=Mycena maculata TaxID=230809 RepID=A0AAD7N0N7_9AGAR|nr:hypothetical protein DFH07DRAFT_778082 [Mycena maculata]